MLPRFCGLEFCWVELTGNGGGYIQNMRITQEDVSGLPWSVKEKYLAAHVQTLSDPPQDSFHRNDVV